MVNNLQVFSALGAAGAAGLSGSAGEIVVENE
jgi:hypothetical protein